MDLRRTPEVLKWLGKRLLPGDGLYRFAPPELAFAMSAPAADVIARHLAKYGDHEPDVTAWFRRHLAAQAGRGIVVDVGANFGWYTLLAATGPSVSHVVACEPDAFNGMVLAKNLAENDLDDVFVAPWAIGAEDGWVRLHRYKPSNAGRHSVLQDHGLGGCAVPCFTLDRTLALFGLDAAPILAIKIDVEGLEYAVLAGAGGALARASAVVLEFSPQIMAPAGRRNGEVLEPMYRAGFLPFRAGPTGDLEPADRAALETFTGQINLIWLRAGTEA